MSPPASTVRLPNGHLLTVSPVFGGYFFKANELNLHSSPFAAGWTVVIRTEEYTDDDPDDDGQRESERAGDEQGGHFNRDAAAAAAAPAPAPAHETSAFTLRPRPFRLPTLRGDNLFISSISNPANSSFSAPASPTRHIAMMLWATLYWYFHLLPPEPYLITETSKTTPLAGQPRGDWRLNIRREGVLRGRNLIQKLERMGLITSEDSTVGTTVEENTPDGWSEMFVSRRSFWQLPATLFLFSLAPAAGLATGSPYSSRPSSPVLILPAVKPPNNRLSMYELGSQGHGTGLNTSLPPTPMPFASGSHLPTYYPPPPPQYALTSGVRHPLRPKPPRQGEVFYTRYVPSVGQYLSFRTASLSPKAVPFKGPTATPAESRPSSRAIPQLASILPDGPLPMSQPTSPIDPEDTILMSDVQLLYKWMNNPRVAKFWRQAGPESEQESFLRKNMTSKHAFPAIGLWDGKPFGYFEIYWVKEDVLGQHLGGEARDYDRGFHVLVGEDEFRGKQRVKAWSTAIAHWAFASDYRTEAVVLEPRIDNERFISHLTDAGFLKEREVTFPHKQSAYVKMRRDNFEGPTL